MKLAELFACMMAAVCLLLSPAAGSQSSEGTSGTVHEYMKDAVPLSAGQVRSGSVCVNFVPFLEADYFFKGLERIDTPEGSVFRRNSQVIENFPNYLVVEINIRIEQCDADLYTPAPSPAFVKGMHFRAQWKRGLYLRPVAGVLIEGKPVHLDEGDNRMLFVMKLHDRDVPLTDHLIISVISAQGKLLSRMSARL